MDLKGIISISGQSGLYKVIKQSQNGLIVESIADGKRSNAYATQRVSALEDISIFTTGDDVPLKEVFQKISDQENGGPAMDAKASNDELKKYFKQVLPDFDEERVYPSDMKKVITWYNLLQSKDLLKPSEEEQAADAESVEASGAAPKKGTAKKKEEGKPAAKKAAPKGDAAKASSKSKATKTSTTRKTGA